MLYQDAWVLPRMAGFWLYDTSAAATSIDSDRRCITVCQDVMWLLR